MSMPAAEHRVIEGGYGAGSAYPTFPARATPRPALPLGLPARVRVVVYDGEELEKRS